MTQVEVRKIFCLDCGYHLHGLATPQCPECGRSFDPRDSETFARSPRRWPAQFARTLPFVTPLLLLLFWWVYLLFMPARAPITDGFDLTLFFVGMSLKVATVVSLPIVLARVYVVMAGRPRVAVVACFVWAACAVVIIGGWMAIRTVRPPIMNLDDLRPLTAAPAWVPAKEFAVAILLCAVHAMIGVRLGRHPSLAAPVGVMATSVLLATMALFEYQVDANFDLRGGIWASALAADLMYFFAPVHPHTTIASTIYVAVALSSAWLIGRYGGDQSSPMPK